MTAIIYGSRLRDRVEAQLPTSQAKAKSTDEIAKAIGVSPPDVARACNALRRFGAAKFKLGPVVPKVQRRKLWWRV